MKIATVLSQKGGGGKTTIASNIAVASAWSGQPTVLIDMDPQQSAVMWGALRAESNPSTKGTLTVRAADAGSIVAEISKAKEGKAKLVVIDTPPAAAALSELAARAAHASLVVIRPSVMDILTLGETFKLQAVEKGRPFVLMNQAPVRGPYLDDARLLVTRDRRPLAPLSIRDRIIYQEAFGDGLGVVEAETSKGAARTEILALHKWLQEVLAATKDKPLDLKAKIVIGGEG